MPAEEILSNFCLRLGSKAFSDGVAGINAPRRTAEYNGMADIRTSET
jgi:hypothetical protein